VSRGESTCGSITVNTQYAVHHGIYQADIPTLEVDIGINPRLAAIDDLHCARDTPDEPIILSVKVLGVSVMLH
jgi:hypothetical protein